MKGIGIFGTWPNCLRFKTYVDGKGQYNVAAENVGSLVVGGAYQKLNANLGARQGTDKNAPGEMRIYIGDNAAQPIEKRIRGGKWAPSLD